MLRCHRHEGTSPSGERSTMDLALTDEDAELLREILDTVLRDLSYEISNTDNASYRSQLRDRRERIEGIHRQVSGGAAA